MNGLNRSHQSELFDPAHARPVTVLGVGSVGSHVALQLALLGASKITVWDGDDVRSHNLPMSMVFGIGDLGRLKVEAVAKRIKAQTDIEIRTVPRMYAGEPLKGSVVACVDTMKARQLIWEVVRNNPTIDIFVDTRIHERYIVVYSVRPCRPEDMMEYEAHLYPDSTTPQRTCGAHGIVNVTTVAASLATHALTRMWSGDIQAPRQSLLLGDDRLHVYE